MRFAHGKTSDGHAVKGHGRDFLGAPSSEVLVHAALHNAEHAPVGAGVGLDAALRPAGGAGGGMVGIVIICGIGNTFIEGHGNVAAQIFLGMDGYFR